MAQRKTTRRKFMTLDAPGYPRLEIICDAMLDEIEDPNEMDDHSGSIFF